MDIWLLKKLKIIFLLCFRQLIYIIYLIKIKKPYTNCTIKWEILQEFVYFLLWIVRIQHIQKIDTFQQNKSTHSYDIVLKFFFWTLRIIRIIIKSKINRRNIFFSFLLREINYFNFYCHSFRIKWKTSSKRIKSMPDYYRSKKINSLLFQDDCCEADAALFK